jgi:hypothetical protein
MDISSGRRLNAIKYTGSFFGKKSNLFWKNLVLVISNQNELIPVGDEIYEKKTLVP